LDRQKLGGVVFQDEKALADLNRITHHYVNDEVNRQIQEVESKGCPAVAVDAIALLEGGLGERCDVTVGIVAPVEVRVRRIMEREGISEEYARTRIAAQKPEAYYEDNCTYTIRNDSTPEEFAQKARTLFAQILKK
jgi:dephospho-CoA kinase